MTIQLQNLPAAASPLSPSGITHYNDGTTDYQASVTQMQAILINALDMLTRPPQPLDLMMVQPAGGSVPTGQVYFSQVGFTAGTQAWFYQATAPASWVTLAISDSLLAVVGGTQAYNVTGGTVGGTWQQEGVNGGVPGGGLSIAQIPAHQHQGNLTNTSSGMGTPRVSTSGNAGGGLGGNAQTGTVANPTFASGQPHNHGNTWRPTAACGILCVKTS